MKNLKASYLIDEFQNEKWDIHAHADGNCVFIYGENKLCPPNYYHFFIYATKLKKLAYGYVKLQSAVKKTTISTLDVKMDGKSFFLKYPIFFKK